jgi:hypothetical protein
MENDNTPFVAIIGGLWTVNAPEKADAEKVAREIGVALANAGFGLVVYFSDPASLEPYVVSGYVKTLSPGHRADLIKVRYARSQAGKVKFSEQAQDAYKSCFELKLFPSDDWEAPFYRSLVEAEGVDAVLLMAGARSTLIAGQISVARRLPVLAIDKFGGSSAIIHQELATRDQEYPSLETRNPAELVGWLKSRCVMQAKERTEALKRQRNYLKSVTQGQKTFWTALSFAALLLLIFFGIGGAPNPQTYPFLMFAGLVAAGATGALVRSVIWAADEMAPIRSLLLGGIAGLVVGAAYLVPQFIGAPEVLASKPTDVVWKAKVQFISAILVAVSAGVGFDTVFSRLKKDAEQQPISVSGKKDS